MEFGLLCERRFWWTPIWIADAHRDGKRFVVRANEKLAAFPELESAMRACGDCKPASQTVLNKQ